MKMVGRKEEEMWTGLLASVTGKVSGRSKEGNFISGKRTNLREQDMEGGYRGTDRAFLGRKRGSISEKECTPNSKKFS